MSACVCAHRAVHICTELKHAGWLKSLDSFTVERSRDVFRNCEYTSEPQKGYIIHLFISRKVKGGGGPFLLLLFLC